MSKAKTKQSFVLALLFTSTKEIHESHMNRHSNYSNLCKIYPKFNFSFRNDIISWDEYGLYLPNDILIFQRDVIADDLDIFETQVESFFSMWKPSGNKMNGEQISEVCSSSLWHFETEQMECEPIICGKGNQQLCLKMYQCFGFAI